MPERFFKPEAQIRPFASKVSQFAIRQLGVYLPPLIAKLLKQLAELAGHTATHTRNQ
jgi:hypothetical protein